MMGDTFRFLHAIEKDGLDLKDRGIGVLITDHNVRATLNLVDRAYIIHKGQILLEGNAELLAKDPKAREVYLGPEFDL